jgi:hypothetical protein
MAMAMESAPRSIGGPGTHVGRLSMACELKTEINHQALTIMNKVDEFKLLT